MATLFGPSPAEVLMARQKEQEQMDMLRQQQIGQQGGQFGVFAPLYQAGLQFGDIGASAMRQGLFPQQADPSLQKATAIQGVLSKYAGQDMQSADVLKQISKDLMPIDPDASIKALTIAKSLVPESPFAKINPKDYTPESLAIFKKTRDEGDLRTITDKDTSPYTKIDPKTVTKASLAKYEVSKNITDLEFLPDVNKGTEFERLIEGLSPTDQITAKTAYLKKLVGQTMPPAVQALVLKDIDTLSGLSSTIAEVAGVLQDLKSDKLNLGLKDNFVNSFKTIAGRSDEGSRAFARFNATLETLRNQSLRLNTGVQTEGDAVRALNEFMAGYSKYDTKTAIEQWERVVKRFAVAEQSKQKAVVGVGNRYGEDLSFYFPTKEQKTEAPKYPDSTIMQEFNDPKNKAWQPRGFEAFKQKFLELNK
jgi:hypothetical protein